MQEINIKDYETVIEGLTISERADYSKTLSTTIKEQTIRYNRALFMIGQKSVTLKWFEDNMSNAVLDYDKVLKESYDKYDSRTRDFVATVTTVSYAVGAAEIKFSDALRAKGFLYEGDISKVTDSETLIGLLNDSHKQIDSIFDGNDALKPVIKAHKVFLQDAKDIKLKARLNAVNKSSIELAKLRLKQTITKHIIERVKVLNVSDAESRVAAYRTMIAESKVSVSNPKVEQVKTISEDDAHTKIVNGNEVHKHEGIKGYHPITRVHKSK